MKKPDKIYTLTIAYNDETEEVEYLEETIMIEDSDIEPNSMLIDFSDEYWDEDSIKLLKDSYFIAEA
tara:strand:+ start:78 stop:278 length:201 start_codon:yes stop_codon:yes gene_type:complete